MSAFRPRPDDSSQQRGRAWERFWAKLFGVEPQRGSGNQWFAKLDVGDGSILWSLKYTDAESFRLSKDIMREAESAVSGLGGVGGSTIPGAAISLSGNAYVVLGADDFLRLLAAEGAQYIVPSKADQKRSRAAVPGILRDD